MPPASARAFFLAIFVINCILWSQSRYGQGGKEIFRNDLTPHLSKRTTVELIGSNTNQRCQPHDQPVDAQCTHANNQCPRSDTFLAIPYLHKYFCTQPLLRPLVFVGLLVWLFFLFSTLGISAADFFTPNLATIADLLGLDEDVAGVTFLAFGNGSPDLFSTFSAMRANSGSLAVGELLGAATFIVSFVVGWMCIIQPFKVDRAPFLRDVGFFTAAVSVVLATLWDGKIVWWEACSLICLYVVYVLFVVMGSWWERRQERKRRLEQAIRSEYADDMSFDDSFSQGPEGDQTAAFAPSNLLQPPTAPRARASSSPGPLRLIVSPNSPRRRSGPLLSASESHAHHRISQMPSFSLLGALEFRQVIASLQNEAATTALSAFDSPLTPFAGGHYHHPSRTHMGISLSEGRAWDAALGVPLSERSSPGRAAPRILSDEDEQLGDDEERTIVPRRGSPDTVSEGDTDLQVYIPQTRMQRLSHLFSRIFYTACPSLCYLQDKTVLGKIAAIFAAPAITALTLTLPVVITTDENGRLAHEKSSTPTGRLIDFEEEGIERVLIAEEEVQEELHDLRFNKWLMATQCVLGPLFCAAVLFSRTRHQTMIFFSVALAGIVSAVLVLLFARKGTHPTSRMARCLMGFVVAIIWILAIADEVVNVLQTFGRIFGLSDAIIGLTVFAVGNSLADLVANTAVAVFAPMMGFAACFGGPMLNILLGVGVSGLYLTQKSSDPLSLDFSPGLVSSTLGLLILLLSTLLFVPLNGYHLTKRWGLFLIVSYVTLMVINVVIELR